MQISLTVTATLRREHGMKGSPYLAEIALWPRDPLSTSNRKDQGPAIGHAHTGCSLAVGDGVESFHLAAPPDIFKLNTEPAFSFSRLTDNLTS